MFTQQTLQQPILIPLDLKLNYLSNQIMLSQCLTLVQLCHLAPRTDVVSCDVLLDVVSCDVLLDVVSCDVLLEVVSCDVLVDVVSVILIV